MQAIRCYLKEQDKILRYAQDDNPKIYIQVNAHVAKVRTGRNKKTNARSRSGGIRTVRYA